MEVKRTVIYYHQALPLFPFEFSFFGPGAREIVFYRYIYPLYVKLFLGKRTYVAVQTEDMKRHFAGRYHFPADRDRNKYVGYQVKEASGNKYVTVVYMTGKATVGELRVIFKHR